MTELLDTHQHLVYPDVAGYGWTDGIPALANKSFSLDDYKSLTSGKEVSGTLFMETGVDDPDYRAETRFVADLAKNPESGIRGIIASCRPESDDGFSEWLDEGDDLNVLAYRRVLHVVDDGVSTTETFRRNVRKIGSRGKVFDLCFAARQLPVAIDLAKACDNTELVLNHCGVPDIAGGGLDPWREHIGKISELPHVNCKLSGVLAYCAPGSATLEAINPYVEHVFDRFGSSRIVWGSDWPVVNLANGLPDWLEVTQKILSKLSEDESNAIGSSNARKIYNVKT